MIPSQTKGPGEAREAYRERYVAFVDLLGFKELVGQADRHPERRAEILGILGRMKRTAVDNPHVGLRLTHFSDSLILSADRTPPGLRQLLSAVDWTTFNLLQMDVLLRGGLAVGGVHHDSDFVFGVGVNEAYALEQASPGHPRILVSDQVRDDIGAAGLSAALERDPDEDPERPFLHHLLQYAEYDPRVPLPGMLVLDGPAERIRRFIANRLRTHSGRVLEKARWFQAYWNRTVVPSGVFAPIE